MKLTFANGKELEIKQVIGNDVDYVNGSSRSTITVKLDPSVITLDELNTILSDKSNVESLKILDTTVIIKTEDPDTKKVTESHPEFVHTGYVLYLKLEKNRLHDSTDVAQREQVEEIMFKLGKKTPTEETLDLVLNQMQTMNIKA